MNWRLVVTVAYGRPFIIIEINYYYYLQYNNIYIWYGRVRVLVDGEGIEEVIIGDGGMMKLGVLCDPFSSFSYN